MSLRSTADRIAEFEKAGRKEWVATITECGKPVEYIMVACEKCNQPTSRQRVIRCSEQELAGLEKMREPSKLFWKNMMRGYLACIVFGIIVGVALRHTMDPVIAGGLTAMVGILTFFLTWIRVKGARLDREIEELRRKILVAHGVLDPKDVGAQGEYSGEYFLMTR